MKPVKMTIEDMVMPERTLEEVLLIAEAARYGAQYAWHGKEYARRWHEAFKGDPYTRLTDNDITMVEKAGLELFKMRATEEELHEAEEFFKKNS